MDRFIINSFLSLDGLYRDNYFLNEMAVNDFQLLTAVWNILLIFIALGFFLLLKRYWQKTFLIGFKKKITAWLLFILWFLFFPNTAYLITDSRHLLNYCPAESLNQVCVANAWMIIFFFSYSVIGWVSFYYLLSEMSELIGKFLGGLYKKLLIIFTIPATALGVLLGLLNRFNSWDVFLYPGLFLKTVILYFVEFDYALNLFFFSLFLYLLYFVGGILFRKIKS